MSSSSVGARWALPLALLTATLARPAFAQSASPQSQADALFAEGRDLLEKGKFSEACAKLARSEELSPAVGTLLNLGYCNEQLLKLRSAMEAYAEAETLAHAAGDTKRATFAKERYAAVEPRAPKLVVRVVPPEAPGLAIKRNGASMPKTDLDRPIPVDPQDYGIEASAPGFATWKGAVIVRGEGAVVTMVVPPLERGGATQNADGGVTQSSIGARRIAALGLGALSALAIGGGIAAGLSAKSRYDDSGAHCDATGCDEIGASIQRGAVTQGNIATALIGLGLLSAGAGVYLWIIGAPEQRSPARAVRLDVNPFGAALGGRF